MTGFRHEALLYGDMEEFVQGTLPLIEQGVARREPVMVAVSADKIDLLRRRVHGDADRVRFLDMHEVGVNPGAIISAWHDWAARRPDPGMRLWGIGEPVWAERTDDELAECYRHECLLNAAFADTPGFRLLCPYDTSALPPSVIERAHESHPIMLERDEERASDRYIGLDAVADLLHEPLPEPGAPAHELAFDADTLALVRHFAVRRAEQWGAGRRRAEDLVLSVSELATNSVRYGGGGGTLRLWHEGDAIVCEVRDAGRIADPLAGRRRPPFRARGGFGLWMVNQLCDLVQVRSSDDGTVVRVRLEPGRRPRSSRVA